MTRRTRKRFLELPWTGPAPKNVGQREKLLFRAHIDSGHFMKIKVSPEPVNPLTQFKRRFLTLSFGKKGTIWPETWFEGGNSTTMFTLQECCTYYVLTYTSKVVEDATYDPE